MKFLIDTDWAIYGLNGEKKIGNKLLELRNEGLAISVISLAEIYEGIYRSNDPVSNEMSLMDFLSGVSVLEINEDICRIFGKQRAKLRKEGKQVGDLDLLIASTCLHYGLIILTNNLKHFGLVENLNIFNTKF